MKKVALITGGSRGIGLGIATELAKAGFHLAVNGVREETAVSEVLTELRRLGTDVIYLQGDISSKTNRQKIVEETLNCFGHINVLVNNAGIAPRERMDILEAGEESFEHLLKVNLQGPYFLTQLVANQMIKQNHQYGFCCIINISSVSATVASVNRGDYCISKAGIAMATRLWASRLGEYDIPVYEIRPGVIRTDMTRGSEAKYDALIANGLTPIRRWGEPEDVGKAVAAVASGQFSFSTGEIINVDGGMHSRHL